MTGGSTQNYYKLDLIFKLACGLSNWWCFKSTNGIYCYIWLYMELHLLILAEGVQVLPYAWVRFAKFYDQFPSSPQVRDPYKQSCQQFACELDWATSYLIYPFYLTAVVPLEVMAWVWLWSARLSQLFITLIMMGGIEASLRSLALSILLISLAIHMTD
jgi:hypothetical protein